MITVHRPQSLVMLLLATLLPQLETLANQKTKQNCDKMAKWIAPVHWWYLHTCYITPSLSLAFRVFPLLVFPLCSFTQYKGYTYICSWLLFWCFWGFFGWLGLQWCLLHQAERRHAINTTVARVTIAIRAVAVATAVVAVLRPPYVIWPNRPADRRSQPFMSIKVILLFFRRCSFLFFSDLPSDDCHR